MSVLNDTELFALTSLVNAQATSMEATNLKRMTGKIPLDYVDDGYQTSEMIILEREVAKILKRKGLMDSEGNPSKE